jgi:hypothetical protein
MKPFSVTRFALVAAMVLASATAWAKDSLVVDVTNASGSPLIVNNGQAVGTIQLFYTVNATQFPLGSFATFNIDWSITPGPKPTNYGTGVSFDLIQSQEGGNVDLVPDPSHFTLTSAGNTGSSTVTVWITNDKDGNPPSNADGTDLVGNLKLDAGSSVGTVTSIQVHIRLVHATNCIKVYNFVTDQDFNIGILSTTNVNIGTHGPNTGKVVSSQPGQYSDNVLIANVCGSDQSFDLGVLLDSSFTTNPAANPGNAVFTYTAAGEYDTSNYNVLLGLIGTGKQQNMCLQNVTMPAGSSLLMTVHSKIKDSWLATSLPADKTFDFSATLYDTVNSNCTGALEPLASPNPATFTLPFTTN